jgi:hypothetical protein
MHEQHEYEQYFFDRPTLAHLADFIEQGFTRPCCLCAPLLGQALVERGVGVTILDRDERFAQLPGFRRYDLFHPLWLAESFDLIVCDPPFFQVSLSQLFTAIRMLSHYNLSQPLLVSYLRRRSANLLGTFSPFNLSPTGYSPTYQTVQALERNEIEFFSNLAETLVAKLKGNREP